MAPPRTVRKALSFHDRLSRLTHHQAYQLLGEHGAKLIQAGRRKFDVDPEEDVYLGGDLFRVRVNDCGVPGGKAVVVVTMISGRQQQLHLRCDQCGTPCEHAGAALGLLLEEKSFLGLAAPPDETVPLELLTRDELLRRALHERKQRAETEKMTLRSLNPDVPWTDYILTSHQSGKSYRVALQGTEPGQSYCSCPDFRTNRLGTCKHILAALEKIRKRFSNAELAKPFSHQQVTVYLDYGETLGVCFHLPANAADDVRRLVAPHLARPLTDAAEVVRLLRQLDRMGHAVLVYPDAETWIERQLAQRRLKEAMDEIRRDPAGHPLRKQLLKVDLLPYQMDGIAFAVGAGRAILADDMGLGKTIQGIGTAELLAREAGIGRVLVVCPASLKSQWRDEIHRFCDRTVELVGGRNGERAGQYASGAFFTVCNYEQVLRDLSDIERTEWDLIILDEGQRIKNWESKTSQVIRSLRSPFALVLSGTPLENRLDELFTVAQFIDDRALGPAYEFFHRHRIVDDRGKVQGYHNLDDVRDRLRPFLLRRTRAGVMNQLPERTTTVVRIRPTAEQLELHAHHMRNVIRITRKPFLTEMDLLLLQKSLLMCRLAANGTVLVDKQPPGFSTKLDRLEELLAELVPQSDRKIILFSEWRMMLDLIEPVLQRVSMPFVRLDGQVPQKQRASIVHRFQRDADCRAILMTNAGSTGLNLQAANVVINVDLPWNPAVLEQRVARAHRMGQRHPVDVYLLVTEETLEERLLETLAMKQDLALAALDPDADVSEVKLESGMEELRRRLERLVGEQATAPTDASQLTLVTAQAEQIAMRRERVAAAGGQLIGAALQMIGELVSTPERPGPDPVVVGRIQSGLTDCVERDPNGRPQLRITLPDDGALQQLAQALAKLLVGN
jgi:superfamily II DNA or RNA helicase